MGAYKIVPNGVTVVTCALEAAIMFSTKLVSHIIVHVNIEWMWFVINSKEVVQCEEDSKISILQQMLDSSDHTLVCTSSLVEALQLKKVCFLI